MQWNCETTNDWTISWVSVSCYQCVHTVRSISLTHCIWDVNAKKCICKKSVSAYWSLLTCLGSSVIRPQQYYHVSTCAHSGRQDQYHITVRIYWRTRGVRIPYSQGVACRTLRDAFIQPQLHKLAARVYHTTDVTWNGDTMLFDTRITRQVSLMHFTSVVPSYPIPRRGHVLFEFVGTLVYMQLVWGRCSRQGSTTLRVCGRCPKWSI